MEQSANSSIRCGEIVGISARFSQRKKLKALQKENRGLKAKLAEAPEEKSVVESVVEETQTPQEETAEVKYEPEAKNEEEAEEEEEKKDENETRF
jgi:predicted ATPase